MFTITLVGNNSFEILKAAMEARDAMDEVYAAMDAEFDRGCTWDYPDMVWDSIKEKYMHEFREVRDDLAESLYTCFTKNVRIEDKTATSWSHCLFHLEEALLMYGYNGKLRVVI